MKKLLIIIISLLFFSVIKAQDLIIQKNGDEIKAKVLEIDDVIIKYHKYENLTGPIYSIRKTEVFMIKYENGTKDVFGKQEEPKQVNPPSENPKQEKPKTTEAITIKRGSYYYHGNRLPGNAAIREILKTNASPDILKDFNKGCNNEIIENVFTYTGFVIFITGALIFEGSHQTNFGARTLAFTGFGIMTIGLPFHFAGRVQKSKSIIKYNNSLTTSYKPELYFGATQNGVGLLLKF